MIGGEARPFQNQLKFCLLLNDRDYVLKCILIFPCVAGIHVNISLPLLKRYQNSFTLTWLAKLGNFRSNDFIFDRIGFRLIVKYQHRS
jgi:hypothetical protein